MLLEQYNKFKLHKALDLLFKSQVTPGVLLFVSGVLALIAANSDFQAQYINFINYKLTIGSNTIKLEKTITHWTNDLLMAIFFLLVSLEIKREFYFKTKDFNISNLALPAICAIGGVVIPALIFLMFNNDHTTIKRGWAIPTATDIAFALGVLLLLGSKVPQSLKLLLTSIAIFDDIIAIAIIGIWYSGDLQTWYIVYSAILCLGLALLNHYGVRKIFPYIIIGSLLWYCFLNSGIHSTLSGVILALFIPGDTIEQESISPLYKLEKNLYPFVYFFILPTFSFVNSGIIFPQGSFALMLHETLFPLPLGIVLGLFLGKQIGIMLFTSIAIKSKLVSLPKDIGFGHLYGISILCGIGFTMSLLIAALAFHNHPGLLMLAKFGILFGSMLSAIVGFLYLRSVINESKLLIY